MTDLEREEQIAYLGKQIQVHYEMGNKEKASVCFELMAHLLAGRSAEQIARMEEGINGR